MIGCRNLKYSSYFHMSADEVIQKIILHSKRELSDSDIYFQVRDSNESLEFYNSLNELYPSELGIMVITHQRPEGHEYVKLVMKTLDKELKDNRHILASKYGVLICNMNDVQNKSDLAHYMGRYFPMISIHNNKNIVQSNNSEINNQDPQHKNKEYNV